MVKIKDLGNKEYAFICPGCNARHTINTIPKENSSVWWFNGDVNNPTFKPSINCMWGTYADPSFDAGEHTEKLSGRCHFHITDGKIQFCTDCTHDLKGKTVELPELPEYF